MISGEEVIVVGYSGHAFVVIEILLAMGLKPAGYCDVTRKNNNPYGLEYLGHEADPAVMKGLRGRTCVVAIGDNALRHRVSANLLQHHVALVNAIHPSAVVSGSAALGLGVMIGAQCTIGPRATIGDGVICNTGSIVEHECDVRSYGHIGPGAILAGNVRIGSGCLVGANSVVRQGLNVGTGAIIGAGAVVVSEIPEATTVAGNPARPIG
jgi:sugar O-acyltransferase (sialic acid O-acetyltransferase NeuD family)